VSLYFGSKLPWTHAHTTQLADLDAKIAEVVREVRSFRNRFAPINFMPDEILSSIFSFSQFKKTAIKSACRVAAVCQRWRSAAISHAALWSTVRISMESTSVEQALEYLSRSKETPLSFTWNLWEDSADLFGLLSRHSARIQSLYLETHHEEIVQIAEAALNFPLLERLEVQGSCSDEPLPPIFLVKPPTLRHVRFEGYCSWPTGTFNTLTSLHLQHRGWSNISLAFFIAVLEENPGLQQLTIHDHGPISDDNTAEFSGIAELPCLTHISLGFCDSRLILSHVRTSARRINVTNCLTSWSPGEEVLLETIPADILFQSHDRSPRELTLSIASDKLHLIITDNSGNIVSISEDLKTFQDDDRVLSDRLQEISAYDVFCGLTHLVVEVEKGHSRTDNEVSRNV
jgi:hypothetical protein